MQCNIDSKGKVIRLLSGLIHLCAGVTLLALAAIGLADRTWVWVLGAVLLVGGAFQVFEGWAGWCVLRAMGLKTRF